MAHVLIEGGLDPFRIPFAHQALIADLDLTLEASCEGTLLENFRDYCVVLGFSSDRDPFKSGYVSMDRGGGRRQWRWTRPFGDKM